MDTFAFPFHTVTHVYPKGNSFQFGGGYEFSAAPQLPVQRRFTLRFAAMQWFLNDDGTPDTSAEPALNIWLLDLFYRAHYTWKAFVYPHPVFGNITVKFASDTPFEMPESLPGGTGATKDFELVLVEQG